MACLSGTFVSNLFRSRPKCHLRIGEEQPKTHRTKRFHPGPGQNSLHLHSCPLDYSWESSVSSRCHPRPKCLKNHWNCLFRQRAPPGYVQNHKPSSVRFWPEGSSPEIVVSMSFRPMSMYLREEGHRQYRCIAVPRIEQLANVPSRRPWHENFGPEGYWVAAHVSRFATRVG